MSTYSLVCMADAEEFEIDLEEWADEMDGESKEDLKHAILEEARECLLDHMSVYVENIDAEVDLLWEKMEGINRRIKAAALREGQS